MMEENQVVALLEEIKKSNRLLSETIEKLEINKENSIHHTSYESGNFQPLITKTVPVLVKFEILRINEIECKEQRLKAKVAIQLIWVESEETIPDLQYGEISEESLSWKPTVSISNIMDSPLTCSVKVYRKQRPAAGSQIVLRKIIQASFLEELSLEDFPLDYQELTVILKSERREVILFEDQAERSIVSGDCLGDCKEWQLDTNIRVLTGRPDADEAQYSGNVVSASWLVARNPNFYIFNICLPMAVLTSLSLCSFAVPQQQSVARMGNTLTILLTAVAFKIIIFFSLPRISYLNLLEYYLLTQMSYISFMEIMYALLSFVSPDNSDAMDTTAFLMLVVVQIIVHLIFVLIYFFKMRTRAAIFHPQKKPIPSRTSSA